MEEAAKDESTTRQNAGNEVSLGVQHIYSNLAKARQAGEDEYGPKCTETDKETDANNQSGLGDNTGKEGGLSTSEAHSHRPSVSERLTSLSLEPTLPRSKENHARSKKDRIEALKQQGLGRRRRDKENIAATGSGQDTDTDSEADKKNKAKPKKKEKNVLTRMEAVTGPLSLLHKSVSERLKVKVWIRSANCIRGICTGYILAFDTHFNMVMADVDEVYKPAGNTNPSPTKKVRKKKKKRAIKAKPMENTNKDELQETTETSMDIQEPASGDLKAECQVDGAVDSSDSESETNSPTTTCSDDSTEGDSEEESDASSDSGEDLEELMAKLDKLKDEYENLKTGETPMKQSPKDISSPSKERARAASVVEPRTEESTSRRRSHRLQSQSKPVEVGTSQGDMKTTRSTRRHGRDRGRSSASTTDTDSKTVSASRNRSEKSKDRDRSASMEKQTSADEEYKSHTRKDAKTYPEEISPTYQKEREVTPKKVRGDHQKSARLESMIAHLRVDEDEQTREADTPPTDLRNKLRLMRESKAEQSKTQTTSPRKIRSQVTVLEHRRKCYRSSESDSDSDDERGSRKQHSSDRDRGRDDRYRNRSPQRDMYREPRKGGSKDRDRHRDSDREREYERRKEHEKRKEPERPKEYEELDRQKKREQYRGHERANEHDRENEYDRQKEGERHSRRDHEGDREYKRQNEYEGQKAYERQKDQERPHERGKVQEREERKGEGYPREHEKSKSRESYKDYDRYKESEGYSRKHEHRDEEMHRKFHMGDDKRASFPKDDAHKTHSEVKSSTQIEGDKTSDRGDYHQEHRSKGDQSSVSKYVYEYKLAISAKPADKQELLPGGHVTPHAAGRTMKPSILQQLRGTSLGDAGLYQRHVKQMMIRGDNVVMVSIVP